MYSGYQETIFVDETIYDTNKIDFDKNHTSKFVLFDFA